MYIVLKILMILLIILTFNIAVSTFKKDILIYSKDAVFTFNERSCKRGEKIGYLY